MSNPSLEERVRQLEQAARPDPDAAAKRGAEMGARFLGYVTQALEKMGGDIDKATGLFLAWMEQSSEVREAVAPAIREAIESRVKKAATEAAAK